MHDVSDGDVAAVHIEKEEIKYVSVLKTDAEVEEDIARMFLYVGAEATLYRYEDAVEDFDHLQLIVLRVMDRLFNRRWGLEQFAQLCEEGGVDRTEAAVMLKQLYRNGYVGNDCMEQVEKDLGLDSDGDSLPDDENDVEHDDEDETD